jgi:hypothetical protein
MNDSEFDELLRVARGKDFLPPSFQHEVWRRIECAERSPSRLAVWFEAAAVGLGRPWAAATAVAATITFGLWFGAVSAPEPKDASKAYAESISPFAHSHGR